MAKSGTPAPGAPEDIENDEIACACEFFETEEEAYERIQSEVEREAYEKATRARTDVLQGEQFEPDWTRSAGSVSYAPPASKAPSLDRESKENKKPSISTKLAIILAIVLAGFITGIIPAVVVGVIWLIQATFSIAVLALIAYIVYRLTRKADDGKKNKERDSEVEPPVKDAR